MDFGQVLGLIAPYIIWIVIAVAVFSYLLAQYYQRKVFPRVEYHRTGPNSETYQCVEVGNRVMFTTGSTGMSLFGGMKKKTLVTAIMQAQPEIKIFGFKTIRLHHVIEGFNETVDIRSIKRTNPMTGGALAVAEGVMATSFEAMQRSIPKGKGDWMMHLIFMALGVGWGLIIGILFA